MRYYIEEALALAYGIVVSPKETLAVIVPEQRLREGVVVWSLSVLLSVVSVWAQWQDAAVWTAIAMYGGAAFCLPRASCCIMELPAFSDETGL